MTNLFRNVLIGFLAMALFPVCSGTASALEGVLPDTVRTAAEKGDAEAQYRLAICFAKGTGVTQDYSKAAEYLRRSAEQGYAVAQNDLGALYARGQGVKQDYEEA